MTTWFELAEEIGRLLGVEPDLVPVKVADVPMRARRPQYAALANDKLARAGIPMPTWQDALRRYLADVVAAQSQSLPTYRESAVRPVYSRSTAICAASRPTARHDVSPGESIPATWTRLGTRASGRIMKSAKA